MAEIMLKMEDEKVSDSWKQGQQELLFECFNWDLPQQTEVLSPYQHNNRTLWKGALVFIWEIF